MSHPSFDPSMRAQPPSFTSAQALAIAEKCFDVIAADAISLGSERDQAFLLLDGIGHRLTVMKVSNAAEDPAVLDMEQLVVDHIAAVDPSLPIARPWASPRTGERMATYEHDGTHWVRCYDVLPGHSRVPPTSMADDALVAWGATTARLGRAMRGFFHPRARRLMPWDASQAPLVRPLVPHVADQERRHLVVATLDRFDEVVAPRLSSLRAQCIHGDLSTDNALADDAGLVTGIIDFGDMTFSPLVVDLASVLDNLCARRSVDDLFRVARLVVDGYQQHTPLEDGELAVLVELWAARAAIGIAVSAWRAAVGLEEAAYAERSSDAGAAMLDAFLTMGWDASARRLGADRSFVVQQRAPAPAPAPAPSLAPSLAQRRDAALGPAIEALSYDDPIHLASASGVWMTAVDGRHYLDAYNNVPCVGHAHPRVVEAITRQARRLNTNLRYLHASAIELAERLKATLPPSLDTVMFVNSGSEANDVAWRMAVAHTGNIGGLCTAFAYHGITDAVAALSPEITGNRPVHVERWEPPDAYRGRFGDEAPFRAALDRLAGRGLRPALAILDGVLQSDGVLDPPPALVQQWVERTRAAGGLWVADEVQGGHGRTGEAMWSFQRFGIEPDLVTLGKPMGNGHPIAAVITRREIAASLVADGGVFFSTFGGNPVAAAAGLAVLDVLEDERVLDRVGHVGSALRAALREASAGYGCVGDVRGVGLAVGVEIVHDATTREPAADVARAIKEGLRERGVLVGTCGAAGNVLKVRPPLAFRLEHVPVVAAAFAGALAALPSLGAGVGDDGGAGEGGSRPH